MILWMNKEFYNFVTLIVVKTKDKEKFGSINSHGPHGLMSWEWDSTLVLKVSDIQK
jgi:hypothetical protein